MGRKKKIGRKKKTGRKSAVKTSPFRKEIEEMLIEGKTPDFISKYLKSNGESISRSAIYRYKNDEFNIHTEAISKYNDEKSNQRLDKASDDLVDDLKIIDNQILKVSKKINISNMSDDQLSRYLNNLLNTKAKYLGLDKLDVNVNNDVGTLFDEDLIQKVVEDKREKYDD